MKRYSKILTLILICMISVLFWPGSQFNKEADADTLQFVREDLAAKDPDRRGFISNDLPYREGLVIEDYFILHAAIKTEVKFASNVFYANEDEKRETITVLTPSVGIEIPMQDSQFSLEYDAPLGFFNRYTEQNYTNHRVRSLLEIDLTDYEFIFYDTYRRFTNIAGHDDELGSSGRRTREERNLFGLAVSAEFDQLEYKVGYENNVRKFLGKNQIISDGLEYTDYNHMYNQVDVEVGYKLFPKTTVLAEVVAGHLYYRSDFVPSSYYTEALLGFKGEWFNKLVFDVRGGVKYQDYGKSDRIINKDYIDFVARGNVSYKATDDDVIRLGYIRTNHDSIYENMAYYESNFVSLDYTHRFNDKLTGNVFASWQLMQYPHDTTVDGDRAKRYDNIYSIGPILRYDINKWVSLQAGYEYRRRRSRFDSFDYQNHVTKLQITAGF